MADKSIKGITIEIGGNTEKLTKALNDVSKNSTALQKELRQVDKALKFDPGNAELLGQKFQVLSERANETSRRLALLKNAQKEVDEQFRQGKINDTQYRAFNREVIETENVLKALKGQMQSVQDEQANIAKSTKQLDTVFKATNTTIDNYSQVLGTKLTNAIKNGSAGAKQLETALNKIGQEVLGAKVDLDKLKASLDSIDDGNSIKNVTKELQTLSKEAKQAEQATDGIGSSLSGLAGGLAVGAGIGATVEKALSTESLNTKIAITFDIPDESMQSVKDATKTIESYGLDGQEALEAVRRQWALNADATDEANLKIVEGAGVIASSYKGIDITELIQEVNEFASGLKIGNDEALAMTNALLKAGFPPEQIDILAEYGSQMERAGFKAQEIQAIFEKGIDTKTWNIDNLNDGVQEARILMAEFGQEVPKAMSELLSQAGLSEVTFQSWGKAVASGGEQGAQAMADVSTWLKTIEDDSLRNAIGAQVYGTMWETQGNNLISVFQGLQSVQDKTVENQNSLNDAIEKMNQDPTVILRQSLSELNSTLQPVYEKIAQVVTSISNWIKENPTLAATITAVVTAIGIILGVLTALAPVITAVVTTAGALGVSIGAVAAPIGIAIAAISALIAIGVALYKNWDEISAYCKEVWGEIKDFLSETWEKVKTSLIDANDAINKAVDDAWNWIKDTVSSVNETIQSVVGEAWDWITKKVSSVSNGIKTTVETAWNTVKTKVTSILTNIKNTITTKFTEFKNSVMNKMTEVKTSIETKWNEAKTFLSKINLFQIGRDIVQGLINGIGGMFEGVRKKVESLASSIPGWLKKILGIHSPSRVMMELGEWVGIGLAEGIQSTEKVNEQITRDISEKIIATKESYQKESLKVDKELADKVKAVNKKANDAILKIQKNANKKKRKLTKEENAEILSIREDANDEIEKLEEKAASDRAKIAVNEQKEIEAHHKELLESIKSFVADKKSLNQMSLLDEVEVWSESMEYFKGASDQRILAQNEYKKALQALNDEIVNINSKYTDEIAKINDDYIKKEQEMTNALDSAINSRRQTLTNFASLFDEYTIENETSGIDLINNLRSQVVALNTWRHEMDALTKRGILDDGLLSEISEMGVGAVAELIELNKLTDAQLTEYNNLYKEKLGSVSEQIDSEFANARGGMEFALAIMGEQAETQLTKIQAEWAESIKGITQTTEDELMTLETIGKQAGQGLLNGLSSMADPLSRKAKEIANNISQTIKDALKVKSPSRVMMGIGENVGEGLVIGMDDMIKNVSKSSARLSEAVTGAHNSLKTSKNMSQSNAIAQQQIIQQSSNSHLDGLINAIIQMSNRPIQNTVNIDGRVVTDSVSSYQLNDMNIKSYRLGGVL